MKAADRWKPGDVVRIGDADDTLLLYDDPITRLSNIILNDIYGSVRPGELYGDDLRDWLDDLGTKLFNIQDLMRDVKRE